MDMDPYYLMKITEHFYVVKLVLINHQIDKHDNVDDNNNNDESATKLTDLPKDANDDKCKVFDIFVDLFHIRDVSK